MLQISKEKSGKVKNGTFSIKVDGVLRPTKEAIYIITEAFELEALHGAPQISPYMKFSDRTRYEINEKYGLDKYLMVLSYGKHVPGDRILGARDMAFNNYMLMTIKH